MFVDGKKYKATKGLWELLSPNLIETWSGMQDKQAYKQILLQSNVHRVNYTPSGKIKAKRALNIHGLFHNCLRTQRQFLGNRYNNNVTG